jgi:polysaccharide pyruvyl transferase WcaK-like protein
MKKEPDDKMPAALKCSKRPMITVFGECESTNLGDQAIALGVADYFIQHGFRLRFYTLGGLSYFGEFTDTNDLLQIYATTDSAPLHSARTRAPKIKLPWALKALLRYIRNLRRMRQIQTELSKSKAVIFGGGAILDDEHLHFPISLYNASKRVKHLGIPMYCLGASSEGRYSRIGQWLLGAFLKRCENVGTRDQETIHYLQGIYPSNYSLYGDFAFELERIQAHKQGASRATVIANQKPKTIFFNVSSHAPSRAHLKDNYEQAMISIIQEIISQAPKTQVILGTTGVPSDGNVAHALQARLGSTEVKVFEPKNLPELQAQLKQSDTIVSTRLHSAILGISIGTPAVALQLTQKIVNFFTTIGLEDYVIDYAKCPAHKSAQRILQTDRSAYYQAVKLDAQFAARKQALAAIQQQV